jgi:hypothetical protein
MKAKHAKVNILKYSLIAVTLSAILEAEMAYFLLSEYLFITVIFKIVAIISLIGLCLISIKIKDTIKNIHKTLIPFILLMTIGSLVISFSIIAAISIYIVGVGYLIYYYLKDEMLSKNSWILFGVGAVVVLGVAMFFIRAFDAQAILVYILAILLLLVIICALSRVGKSEYPTYLFVISFIFLMMYLYRDYNFLYSIFYSLLFNFSLAMFIIEKISNKNHDIKSNNNETDNIDEIEMDEKSQDEEVIEVVENTI